jgi:hypothetical protein
MNELTNEPHVRETAQRLKQNFLDKAAPIVDQYVAAALGVADFTSVNAGAREEVWEVLKKLMLQSSDKLELDIKSAEDVLDAVSSGKCTFEEGDKLLKLFKQVKDIETAGMLEGGNTGIQINILSGSEPVSVQAKPIETDAGHEIIEGEIRRAVKET